MNKFFYSLLLLCIAYSCSAQTLWTGDVSADWHDANNWTQGVPTTGQTATIPGSAQGGVFPTVSQALIIDFTIQSFGGSITFMADAYNNGSVVNSSGGTMTLNNGATFTNSGTVTFLNDGIFENDGTFINYGTFNQNGNGIFNNNPQGNFINYGTIGNIGNYNNDGTLENRGNLTNSSQFINNGLTRNFGFFSNTFVSTFTNASSGQLINETGAQLFIDNTFNNNGQITDNGNTNVNGQGMINNNGTMDLNGLYSVGTMFNNDGTVNNSGNFKVNFGTLNNDGIWNNSGRLDDVGRLNNNAGATLNNTNVVAVASCSKMFQYASNVINNVTNDGVVYEISGTVNTNAASQGRELTNENDNPLPFVQCKDINIQLDATGNIEITPGDLILDADAKYCNIVTVAADQTSFSCDDLGANTVEFSITDGFGGTSICSSIVTIIEQSPNPCASSFLNYCTSTSTNASSEFIQSVTMTSLDNNSGNDNGYADFTNLISELDFGNFYDLTLVPGFPNATQNVAWQVWVDWNIDGDFDDEGELVVDEISNTTVVGSVNIPGTAVPGTTRMRVSMKRNSAANACQNFSNGEVEDYTIKVNSDITIQQCPENQVVSAQPGATTAPAGWIPAKGFSTCPNSIQIALIDGLPNGSQFPLGITTNTLEFTDGCDGVKTCSFTITVNPTPVNFSLDCPSDIILMGNADLGGAIANWIPPFPTATCPQGLNPPTQISGPSFGDFLPMGSSTQICYETSDNCGNADNCCFFIFVQNPNNSLTFNNCPTTDIVLDAQPGATGATVSYANLTTTSDCTTGDVTLDILDGLPSGSFFPLGTTQVVYRAFDDCNSADLCEFNVTVNSTASTISINCPDDIVLNAAPGAFSQVVSWPAVTATSDCAFSLVSVAQTEGLPNGSAFPVGNTVIIYSISDGCGNSEICTFNVTINVSAATLDLTCPADINVDAAPGEVGTIVTWNDPAISTDCFNGGAEATLVSPLGSGSTFPLGSKEVIYFGSDDCGNTTSCSFFVNVTPVSADLNITCPNDITETININQNNTTITWSAPTSSTTCSGNVTTTQIAGPTSGSAFTPGITTITYSASDDCGNVEICSFNITINVTIPSDDPEIDLTCLNDITVTAALGATSASVGFDVPTATTICNAGGGSNSGGGSFDCSQAPTPSNNAINCYDLVPNNIPGFIYMGQYGSSKYYCSETNETWTNAAAIAFQNGGHLAVINNANENNFIQNNIVADVAWIGYTDEETEGIFEWVWGNPTYSNWLNGEPNDEDPTYTNGADYAAIVKTDGLWRDRDGINTYEYVMEIPANCAAPNFTFLGENEGSKYYISTASETWEQANAIAQANGVNLVTINDAAENAYLTSVTSSVVWIGFSDKNSEGNFEWADGSAVTYTNWDDGQPDDWQGYGGEDYTALRANGKWNDENGLGQRRYVVEVACPFIPPSCAAPDNVSGFTLIGEFEDSKYYIYNSATSWTTAKNLCTQNGGHLSTVSSQAENDFIQNNTNPASGSVWIGYNAIGTSNFSWDNGEPNGYENWASGEPNEATNDVAARLKNDNGEWTDRVLTNSFEFIMEIPCGSSCGRITDGLQVLYDFKEGSGNIITDVSGVGSPLNLTIANPTNTNWLSGGCGLAVNAGTIAKTSGAASKIITAVKSSHEITMEAWVKPANTTQNGPARISTISSSTTLRNATLGQEGTDYAARLRTSSATANGIPTVYGGGLATSLQHVVYTRNAAGTEKIYVNGAEVYSGTRTGNLTGWDNNYQFALFNELTNDRVWLGEMYLSAVYSKALSATEVTQNYHAGECCGSTGGSSDATVAQIAGNAPNTDFPVGTTTVIYEATDDCGNAAYCSFDVTVLAPATNLNLNNCPTDITVQTAAGEETTIVSWTAPTATSDCATGNVVVSQIAGFASGSDFPVGVTTVTYRAVDGCGNEQLCSFFVTVEGTPAPPTEITVDCVENFTVQTAAGANFAVATWTEPTGTTTCQGSDVEVIQIGGLPNGGNFPIGTTVIFYRLEDDCGNVQSCAFNVTVQAISANIDITCPPNVSVNADPDADYGVATFAAATASSTCYIGSPNVAQIAGLPSGSLFPVGNSLVFFRATDDCGNVDVCNFVVTVNATPITNIDPCINDGGDADNDGVCDDNDICIGFDDTVDSDGDGIPDGCDACPNDATGDSDGDGVCDSDDICAGSDDNVDTDGDGTPDGCDACPNDATGDSDGDGVCDSDDICAGSDDNVDTDGDGTPDGCDACPNDATGDSDGDGVCDSDDICAGFDDNADADGDGIPDGCDDLNCACGVDGDTTPPSLQGVPADMVVECDNIPTAATVIAMDECTTTPTISFDEVIVDGACANQFSIERTWTATDDCGNTLVNTQTITVQDTTSPELTNPPSDITLEAGIADDYSPNFIDNCTNNVFVNTEELLMLPNDDCNDYYSILYNWTAVDECGNTTSASRLVTILDDIYKIDDDNDGVCNANDICPDFDDNEDLNNNGIPDGCEGAITITSCPEFISFGIPFNHPQNGDDVSWTEPTATTSCPDGGLTVTQTEGQNNGSFFQAGTVYTITYLIEDACGNTAECSFEISLGSEVGYTFCPSDIELTTNGGGAIATWTEPNPESSCGNTSGMYDQSGAALNGTEFPIGTTEVIYLYTDGCGNQAQCSFDVTVIQNCSPGSPCDDGDICTYNDTFDNDCNCVGQQEGDMDNDGVCDPADQCEGFDDNEDIDNDGIIDGCDPCITGATCDDGDANTENDIYDENCGCAGTPINNEPDCDNISITVDGSNIVVTNLGGAPISSLQIFNSTWGGEFNCFADCNDTEIVPVTPGTYYVYAKYYESNYQLICQNVQTVEVTDAPCYDDDNDGICNTDDVCPGFDDTIDSDNDGIPDGCEVPDCQPGNPCDDGDVCTYNDTYDLDCNCIGTQEADSDNDGVCDPVDQCEGFDDHIDNDNDGIIDGCDPCQTGDTCDDGDANTENDMLDENCNCAGTVIPTEPDCDNIIISVDGNNIVVTNLGGAPISSLQIFNSVWQGEFSCFADCSDTEIVPVTPGTYYVYAKYYESNYQPICQNVQTVVVSDAPCDDDDNDGVCNDDDQCEGFDDSIDMDNDGIIDGCDPCQTGASCDDGNAATINDAYDVDCNCIGEIDECNGTPDSDGDGICDALDVCPGFDDFEDVDNDSIADGCDPCITGASCDDGDANTENDVYDANCGCAGTPIGCDDDDNDGVCNDDDQCEGFDDSIDVDNDGIIDGCDPCITGASCDDGDVNTENDVYDANCGCAGTPISGEPDCNNISITVVDGSIVVTNLDGAPISSLQIFNAAYQTEFSCFADCNATETVAVTAGTYYVYAKYYTANYQLICENQQTITVTNGGGGCTDADGDGYCEADDCDDNNAAIPAAVGTSCNDGDANTTNDEIQADGCTCEGTPVNPGDPNCADISITTDAAHIIVSGLDGAPVTSLQIFNSAYQTEFSCFGDCNATESVPLGAGTYYVYAKYYTANYQLICEEIQTVNKGVNLVSGSSYIDFQAKKGQLIAELYWSVAQDINISHYEVETSVNGVSFEHLSTITAKQSEVPSLYRLTDEQPEFGVNFYRVKAVDFDGNTAISKTRRLNFNVDFGDVLVYPNPAQASVKLSVKDFAGQAGQVVIYDLFGKTVYQQTFLSLPALPMNLDLANYRSGVYHITVAVDGYRLITKKLVVQD